jgi:S1-C subfamily serine protease
MIADSNEARGQGAPQNKQEAVLIVEAVVREVFRSTRQSQTDVIVELSVDVARIGPQSRNRGRVVVPGQGEPLYVHLQELPGGLGHRTPPSERTRIRAYLYPRAQGGWIGSYPDWYEVASNELAAASPDDPPPAAGNADAARGAPEMPTQRSALDLLGVSAEVINAGGDRVVLRISSVKSGSPAEKSGFEPGDVIIGAAKTPITSIEDFGELIRDNAPIVPIVVVSKGQQNATTLDVDFSGVIAPNRIPTTPADRTAAPRKPIGAGTEIAVLGASLESVQINGKPAWKVTELKEGGPAQVAGFELGDLIVSVEGRVLADLDSLNRTLSQASGQATLTVRDVRSGRSVPVKVTLPVPSSRSDAPADAPLNRPNVPAGTGTLGVVVESIDVQEIPTLRVARVERGSAAERAGLRVGDIVEAINDTIVFNPEEFDSIARQAKESVELTLKKGSGRSKLTIPLGIR